MTPLLLVTGSRHLDSSNASRQWANDALASILCSLPKKAILLHGGCPNSPDVWAGSMAATLGLRVVVYHANGRIEGGHVSRWGLSWEAGPLKRNAAMVEAARLYLWSLRGPVAVLGLRHIGATTHGTEHTLGLAERAGLWTEERVFG